MTQPDVASSVALPSSTGVQSAPRTSMNGRVAASSVLALGGAQVLLTSLDLPAMSCPFHGLTGLPCPGCGLSRATSALFHGQLTESLNLHAFAVLVPVLILVLALYVILPERPRASFVGLLSWIERRTRISIVLLALLMGYWLVRLCGIFPAPP